jgi:hypothetical protein
MLCEFYGRNTNIRNMLECSFLAYLSGQVQRYQVRAGVYPSGAPEW